MSVSNHVEIIPICDIAISNPRVRSEKVHKEITENIERVGLKRPITVRRTHLANTQPYALVCGQGRLESCKLLGELTIAAIVIETDAETGHVMSIVENVARRVPRASETMEQIGSLRGCGYSDAEIGIKIGCSSTWVNHVGNLLAHGEKRLLAAAEAGHIPFHLAVKISESKNEDTQSLLLEAYERGDLKGRKVSIVRKILDQRLKNGKSSPNAFSKNGAKKYMSPEELTELYQRDTDRHRLIQKKAEQTQNALQLAQQIFKVLFADKTFCSLLKSEKLTSIPIPLAGPSIRSRRQK